MFSIKWVFQVSLMPQRRKKSSTQSKFNFCWSEDCGEIFLSLNESRFLASCNWAFSPRALYPLFLWSNFIPKKPISFPSFSSKKCTPYKPHMALNSQNPIQLQISIADPYLNWSFCTQKNNEQQFHKLRLWFSDKTSLQPQN